MVFGLLDRHLRLHCPDLAEFGFNFSGFFRSWLFGSVLAEFWIRFFNWGFWRDDECVGDGDDLIEIVCDSRLALALSDKSDSGNFTRRGLKISRNF